MESVPETSVVEHRVRIASSPETVFGYFTDPAKIVRWIGTEATLDPRPGGACRITLNEASVVLGEYLVVEPYRRIVLTWGWEQAWFSMPPQSTQLEISLTPDGEDTVLVLSHGRLPGADAFAASQAGWGHYLPRLRVAAEGGNPGRDPWEDIAVVARALAASNLL